MWTKAARKFAVYAVLNILVIYIFYRTHVPCATTSKGVQFQDAKELNVFPYDRNMSLVFIGGMPRSGTTLLRVLLDSHPDVRCGEETRIIPRILELKRQWVKAPLESQRLLQAGITDEVLDNAVAAFVLEVIALHGEPAPRLCNKDPFTLRYAVYLHYLFPNSKFILLIRDGRAVVHSIITRKVIIKGIDINNYRECLTKWNAAIQLMVMQCQHLGLNICLPVHYEHLVLHPRPTLEKILKFVDIPWNESVLHHDKYINKPGGPSLSIFEKSTDQVIKPINLESLTSWVGKFPTDVVKDMAKIAPMLALLGYNPSENPPNYGKPDSFVIRNIKTIKSNQTAWMAKQKNLIRQRENIVKDIIKKHGKQKIDSNFNGINVFNIGLNKRKNLSLADEMKHKPILISKTKI